MGDPSDNDAYHKLLSESVTNPWSVGKIDMSAESHHPPELQAKLDRQQAQTRKATVIFLPHRIKSHCPNCGYMDTLENVANDGWTVQYHCSACEHYTEFGYHEQNGGNSRGMMVRIGTEKFE